MRRLTTIFAELAERHDHVAQVHLLRPAAVERQHVGAERGLQIGVAPQLIEDDVGDGIALQFDDDAHAFAVRLVPDVGNALDPLFAHEIGDLLDQHPLVDLIRYRGHDQRVPVLADFLDIDRRAHDDRAAALVIGVENATAAEDRRPGRKVRPLDDVAQLIDRNLGIFEVGDAGVDDLAEIVRRNVGRHPDGNAAGTVDQQVGKLGRQLHRLLHRAVVALLIVDRILVEIVEQELRYLLEAAFRVAHRGRRIAVDRAEIALAIDQRHPQRKVLRHTHEGIVDGAVAVRVIVAHHLANRLGRFAVGPVVPVGRFVHRIEDAPVNRLQPVADVRQRPAHDHAHGIIEVRALHFIGYGDAANIARLVALRRHRFVIIRQIQSSFERGISTFCRISRKSRQDSILHYIATIALAPMHWPATNG